MGLECWTADAEFGLLSFAMFMSAWGVYNVVSESGPEAAANTALTRVCTILSHASPFVAVFLSAYEAAGLSIS